MVMSEANSQRRNLPKTKSQRPFSPYIDFNKAKAKYTRIMIIIVIVVMNQIKEKESLKLKDRY